MQCSMSLAALSIFGAKTKIAITGVGSIVIENPSQNGKSNTFSGEVGVIQRRRAAVSVSTLRNDINCSV